MLLGGVRTMVPRALSCVKYVEYVRYVTYTRSAVGGTGRGGVDGRSLRRSVSTGQINLAELSTRVGTASLEGLTAPGYAPRPARGAAD